METRIPRIIIAGTNSGCGKTTVTCAVMKALSNRGLNVAPFKCGPDYIDPMFHESILGTPSTNLDSFFFPQSTLDILLAKNAAGKDISVIEGVMGFYDGMGFDSTAASTYDISQKTRTPATLVLNARGASLSLLAVIEGFLRLRPDNRICGVILDQCSPMVYEGLKNSITEHFEGRFQPLGYLPPMPDCSLESRHLGLITPAESAGLAEKINRLAAQAEKSIDLDALIRIADGAVPVWYESFPAQRKPGNVRIAVAMDKAFCFYYHDNLDLLWEMGAEVVPFSPLNDKSLPEHSHGLYLGGGYPELYAETLSENITMLESIREAIAQGLPCIAECGGFMTLCGAIDGHPMAVVLPGNCYNTGKLSRFGYIQLKAKKDSMLFREDEIIPAHEFHYWDSEFPGSDFQAEKRSGRKWECGYASDSLYAGFPHFHFFAAPQIARRFYQECLTFRRKHD